MNKLSKSQKDEFATVFAMLALYDGGAEVNTEQINVLLEATGNTEVEAFYPIIFSNYMSDPAKMANLIAMPAVGEGRLDNKSTVVATGGLLATLEVPKISIIANGPTPLKFPLEPASLDLIEEHCTLAPVAINKTEVVQLNVRTTHQLLPHQISIEGLTDQPAFQELLKTIQADWGIHCDNDNDNCYLEAHFYKFLLYKEGCFFRRHRDHERLPQMVGTLVLELPSSTTLREGGNLNVWSPESSSEQDPPVASFTTGSTRHVSFAAVRAGCFHEVTELTGGTRCVLLYTLTTTARGNGTVAQPLSAPSEDDFEDGSGYDPLWNGEGYGDY